MVIYKLLDWVERNSDKLRYDVLSRNPSAIPLLLQHPEKIDWSMLSGNPNAIPLLEKYPENIDWIMLSRNPSIIEVDYKKMANEKCAIYVEELMQVALHPYRIQKLLDKGISCCDLEDYM